MKTMNEWQDLRQFLPPEDRNADIRAVERDFRASLGMYMEGAGTLANLLTDMAKMSKNDGAKMFVALVSLAKQYIALLDPTLIFRPTALIKAAINIAVTAAGQEWSQDPFLAALKANTAKAEWQLDPAWMTTSDKDEYKLRRVLRDDYGGKGIQLCAGGAEPARHKQQQKERVRRIAPPGWDE